MALVEFNNKYVVVKDNDIMIVCYYYLSTCSMLSLLTVFGYALTLS